MVKLAPPRRRPRRIAKKIADRHGVAHRRDAPPDAEYWNGECWASLPFVVEAGGTYRWQVPVDWTKLEIDDLPPRWYIRLVA